MSNKPLIPPTPARSQDVVDYLRAHPDFFTHHPDLLMDLSVPHALGFGAVSLIERQVGLLRRQNRDLRIRLTEEEARDKRQQILIRRIHDLSLRILKADHPRSIYVLLRDYLVQEYHAKRIGLYLFGFPASIPSFEGLRFFAADAKLKFMFAAILEHDEPLCDSLQDEHIKALFQENIGTIHSTVLVPLGRRGWDGLLALGSSEWGRYRHGLPLDLLVFVAGLFSIRLDAWLQQGRAGACERR